MKMITFKLEYEDRKVELSTDNEWITLSELFMLWVDFASGCGYIIDKIHMREVWDGVENTEKLVKAIEALEGVKEFVDDLYPHTEQGTVLVPRLAKALETLEELKGQTDA
jgi:hypothetical protein